MAMAAVRWAEAMRRLVEQGKVMETRPGRYMASGSGGEFSVLLERPRRGWRAPPARALQPDGRVLPVNPRYTLGAKASDVAQVAIGEDQLALITRILRRSGREVVGTVQFRPGGTRARRPTTARKGELPVLSAFTRFNDRYQAGDRVLGLIEIDPQGRAGMRITSILGLQTPEVADFTYERLSHDLPGEFPPEVEQQANAYRGDLTLTGKGPARGPARAPGLHHRPGHGQGFRRRHQPGASSGRRLDPGRAHRGRQRLCASRGRHSTARPRPAAPASTSSIA